MRLSDVVGLTQSLNTWSPTKKKHLGSDLDTNRVFANGIPILKSVVVLVSKQRGRALTRKNCSYLNKWTDPLFIGVFRGLRCSGDLIGLNSECSLRGTQRHASVGRDDEYCVSLARQREPATGQEVLSNCWENAVHANNIGPDLAPSRVGIEDGGNSIRFPGNRMSLVSQALIGSQPLEHSQADRAGVLMNASRPIWLIACYLEVLVGSCRGSSRQPKLAVVWSGHGHASQKIPDTCQLLLRVALRLVRSQTDTSEIEPTFPA
ncbi:hypothetical protein TIFTF001_002807 [Ficus carica]|uniref:Uncharacterized protein n=1 Tax=Ficus carica TaxID=3494 RepID=A0AA87Z6I4_FICCA|nr:hypothetical protein TIFTF001_002807 [Ficus carica]